VAQLSVAVGRDLGLSERELQDLEYAALLHDIGQLSLSEPIPGGATAFVNWVAGVVAVYSSLFGIGKLIFGEMALGFVLLAIAAVAFAWIARSLGTGRPSDRPVGLAAEAYAGD
jgi:hypothetical protein